MKNLLNTWLLLVALFNLPFAVANLDSPTSRASGASLGLFLFIHDQVTEQERAEMSEHMNGFLAHLEEVTGRRTTVTLVNNQPGVTDFGYRTKNLDDVLRDWSLASNEYANRNNLPLSSKRHKYMLVTSNKLDWTFHGASIPTLNIGIASLKKASTLPHEIGHLIGADHDAATGFPCQTIMWGNSVTSLNSCHRFSEANQQAIREYLDNAL